jgi:hypothetical protein
MPWLADADVDAAYGFVRRLVGARTMAELRQLALPRFVELVPADVLTWDRIELATGAVDHEAVPAEAEPSGAFAAIVGDARGHPLLFAHAARRRSALRLSEAVDPCRLSHSQLYGDLLHRTGVEYAIAIGVRTERREAVVAGLGRTERQFSERDRDILDLVRPALEDALRAAEARARLVRALAANPPPGSAVVLLDRYGEIEHSSLDAERWLAEHSGGRAPGLATLARRPLAGTAAAPAARQRVRRPAPQRPPAARRSTPLLLETAVLCAATAINDEADIAWELFLSLHAVRERLVDWKPSSACARPPRPSLGPAARARRSPCLGRRSHGSAVVAVSRCRVTRALAGLGAGGPRRLGRPARVP